MEIENYNLRIFTLCDLQTFSFLCCKSSSMKLTYRGLLWLRRLEQIMYWLQGWWFEPWLLHSLSSECECYTESTLKSNFFFFFFWSTKQLLCGTWWSCCNSVIMSKTKLWLNIFQDMACDVYIKQNKRHCNYYGITMVPLLFFLDFSYYNLLNIIFYLKKIRPLPPVWLC